MADQSAIIPSLVGLKDLIRPIESPASVPERTSPLAVEWVPVRALAISSSGFVKHAL